MRPVASPSAPTGRRSPNGLATASAAPRPVLGWVRHYAGLAACLLLAALAVALYRDVLAYAFMYDDGLDLSRGEQRSVLSLLTSAEGAFYYRPLPFLIWKAMHALL